VATQYWFGKRPNHASDSSTPSDINSRLKAIDHGDLPRRMTQLTGLLENLRRNLDTGKATFDAVGHCRDFASRLRQEMDDDLVGLSLPIPSEKSQTARRCGHIYQLLASCYKESVSAFGSATDTSTRQLTESCFWGIACLGDYLTVNYERYLPVEPGTWLDIHELYDITKSEGVNQEPVATTSQQTRTVEHKYKQVLLLGLSDPFQHPFRCLSRAYAQFDDWATFVHLTTDSRSRRCSFAVDPKLDYPATPAMSHARINPERNEKWLDTVELVKRLKREYEKVVHRAAQSFDNVERNDGELQLVDFYHRMIVRLGVRPIRNSARTRGSETCHLVIGLRSVCMALNDMALPGGSERQSRASTVNMIKGTFGAQQFKVASTAIVSEGWEIEDESQEGLKLSRRGADGPGVAIGDLVAVKNESSLDWRVGTIHWAKHAESGLTLGIKRIVNQVLPVLTHGMHIDNVSKQTNSPALLIVDNPERSLSRSLICEPDLYQPGGTYLVNLLDNKGEMIVQATSLVLCTRSFVWFEVVKPQADTKLRTLDLVCPHG